MTRRNFSDAYDPELTREDMGQPTRAEANADAAFDRQYPAADIYCSCGQCLACAFRGRRA